MELGKFLKQRDIFFFLCVSVISTQFVVFADVLTLSCIVPLINNKRKEKVGIEDFKLTVGRTNMELGKVVVAAVRILIIAIVIYLLYYLLY